MDPKLKAAKERLAANPETYVWIGIQVPEVDMALFECYHPWWVSGEDMIGHKSVCIAVPARDVADARHFVSTCFGTTPSYAERFADLRTRTPALFTEGTRFPLPKWAIW